jgi:DNA-binding NarL/FixJ family response regulator
MGIRILLADDHKIVRTGLRTLLEKQEGMEVIAEARDGRMASQLAKDMMPDIIIMDIGMPDLNGIEATRRITSEVPGAKVIALSMHSDRRFVTRMLEAGASGYLLKDCAFEELAQAIQAVMSDQVYLSPDITGGVIGDYLRQLSAREGSSASLFNLLTPREREVLQPLAEGKTTKQIAALLHVSAKTIETHRSQIMEKLNIHSVAELTKYAIREGITTLES